MKTCTFLLLILLISFSACKKDVNSNNSNTGVFTLKLNTIPLTYNLNLSAKNDRFSGYYGQTVLTIDAKPNNGNSYDFFNITLSRDSTLPSFVGSYKSSYFVGLGSGSTIDMSINGTHYNASGAYNDTTWYLSNNFVVNVTSDNGKVITGTFSGDVVQKDIYTTYIFAGTKQTITEGSFTAGYK